jgi:GlpG protein
MREIGTIADETQARTFSDYLYAMGIANDIRTDQQPLWHIWVHDEDKLAQAKMMLSEFLSDSEAPKFSVAVSQANQKRKQEQEDLNAYRKRMFSGQQIFPQYDRMGVLTMILIGICVVVAVFTRLGSDYNLTRYLMISGSMGGGLIEISHGQVWRLITPIFIHFGFLHIFFNMLWLRDLGSMIEQRQSTWILTALVLVIAAISNIGQFFVSGPMFGGMSGVVYGLLGYIWIRGKNDPSSNLFVHPQTVTMMLIWFFLCLTGLLGNVANTVHGIGLATGIIWGYISAQIAIMKRRR